MSFQRIAVIYNPNSGRPRERTTGLRRFTALLEQAGREVAVCPTERPNHASELARQKVGEGFDLIVAHGGDGTMNEVLQGVVGSRATLGFWPGGTANVLAAEIHFPSRVEEVVRRILAGRTVEVTVGKANDRYFLLMVGVGLDAAVAGSVDPWLKKRFGKAAFGWAALQFAWRWELAPFRVQIPGDNEIVGRFVVAGNAHSYGGGFQLTPRAELTDPYLDLCIFTSDSPGDYLRYALAAVLGLHREMPGVIYRKVTSVQITSAGPRAAPVQLDGEVVGTLPVSLQAIPRALHLLI
ncbi:MAG: diacylglycerol/lipid kinase family protein [Bacillota bacterium]